MKVFFVASPRSVRKEPDLFLKILTELSRNSKLLGDGLIRSWINGDLEKFYDSPHGERVAHYKKTMEYVKKSEVVIVEISEHSMSMGYIVNKALENSKFVIALHKVGYEPHFFSGIENERLMIVSYTRENLTRKLVEALERAGSGIDVRFNFFVSPKILTYLDWVAQKRMVPRSVFLRDLIEKEMRKDKEFRQ